MKYTTTERDTFLTCSSVMKGGKNQRISDSIQWDDILTHELASENVLDVRGKVIPDRKNIVDVESGESLSIMGSRYTITQPSIFKEMIQEALDGVPHRIVTGGTFNGRANMLVGVELTGASEFLVGEEKHKSFLYFGGSADGSVSKFQASEACRLACFNRFVAMLKGAAKAKNTQNGEAKFKSILEQIPALVAYQKAYAESVSDMANETVTHDDARAFIVGTVASEVSKVLSPQAVKLSDEIFKLFRAGIANKGETRADILNGFTEYYTHSAAKKPENIMGSSLLGAGAKAKRDAFEALNPYRQVFKERVARGRKLIAAG